MGKESLIMSSGDKCCFNCKNHIFKLMLAKFEDGQSCMGVCGAQEPYVYYCHPKMICDKYIDKRMETNNGKIY